MIIQGDIVMYITQQLPAFRKIQNVYNSEGEDLDYINDLRVLNNQQLKDQYYNLYVAKTVNKNNPSVYDFSEVQKILESFRKCDECKRDNPVENICCENNHKVIVLFYT
jgi:hypothetical protein